MPAVRTFRAGRRRPPVFNDEWDELQVYERARGDFARALAEPPPLPFLAEKEPPKPELQMVKGLRCGTLFMGASLSADGRQVIAGTLATEIVVLSLEDDSLQSIEHRGLWARPCPTGRYLASGIDEWLGLSDAKTGKLLRSYEAHKNAVLSLCFTPDGEAFVSGGRGELFWHEAQSGRTTKLFTAECVDSIVVIDGGRRFLTAGTSGRITFWDGEGKTQVAQMKAHAGRTRCLALSPDGQRLLSGDEFGQVRLWRFEGAGLALEASHEGFGEVFSLAFTPDGHGAFCGSDAGGLALIDLRTGARKAGSFEVKPRVFPVGGPWFVPLRDGRSAVSADANGHFRVWEYALVGR